MVCTFTGVWTSVSHLITYKQPLVSPLSKCLVSEFVSFDLSQNTCLLSCPIAIARFWDKSLGHFGLWSIALVDFHGH